MGARGLVLGAAIIASCLAILFRKHLNGALIWPLIRCGRADDISAQSARAVNEVE
jgi:hypothetical protein